MLDRRFDRVNPEHRELYEVFENLKFKELEKASNMSVDDVGGDASQENKELYLKTLQLDESAIRTVSLLVEACLRNWNDMSDTSYPQNIINGGKLEDRKES